MTKAKTMFTDYEPKSYKEIYREIQTRQIIALMFHDSMADMFDFLGLKGFKRMHEYQYLAESLEHRALKRYYINHHGMLISEGDIDDVEVIPYDWYQYTRMDVTPAVRKQAIQKAMEQYRTWETDTKAFYEKCASYLLAWQKIADFNTVNDLIKDVDKELKQLERLCIELSSVDYDDSYVAEIQSTLHKKYKDKFKSLGDKLC